MTAYKDFSPESIEQEVKEPDLVFTRPELLAHPTLPEPLHGLNPRTIMGAKAWDGVRRKVYAQNGYHCFACGTYAPFDEDNQRFAGEQQLHAHECYEFDYAKCTAKLVEIVALCPICHAGVHWQRSQSLFDKGINDIVDMYIIAQQKENVLNLDDSRFKDWKLEYNGKFYKGKFKNKKEWEEYYEVA